MSDLPLMLPSITVGITGASGAVYAIRLLEFLPEFYSQVNVVLSDSAREVIQVETNVRVPEMGRWELPDVSQADELGKITVWGINDYRAPFASGSSCAEQMIIVPCSMSTVGCIANGVDQNVMHHAAAVSMKEGKQLVIVPRETPLSAVHLRNLTTLAELGVAVIPAMPGFYSGQQTFDDLINFVLQKITNRLGLKANLSKKWTDMR